LQDQRHHTPQLILNLNDSTFLAVSFADGGLNPSFFQEHAQV